MKPTQKIRLSEHSFDASARQAFFYLKPPRSSFCQHVLLSFFHYSLSKKTSKTDHVFTVNNHFDKQGVVFYVVQAF